MPIRLAEPASEAYSYPILIKHLLHTPLATAPHQEIVYRDRSRHTYRDLRRRIARLAAGLRSLGVEAGTTVAVMEWDSHRWGAYDG
jgi:fatty-acyl-CoA synthase